MQRQLKYLFTPLQVGPLMLRNRIVSTPHATHYIDDDQEAYYQGEKAKGGVAMCCLGVHLVDGALKDSPGTNYLNFNIDDGIIPYLHNIAEKVHEYGGTLVEELAHFGSNWNYLNAVAAAPKAASPVYSDKFVVLPYEVQLEEMEMIADSFGKAAKRTSQAGLDGVLIHAGFGNLLSSFISPKYNQRTDEYGGNARNRLKFIFMIIDKIRAAIREDMALGIRINGDEFVEGGGNDRIHERNRVYLVKE
ncbi:hypothetical protein ACFLWF_00190 [Chloroflexota bacterium]